MFNHPLKKLPLGIIGHSVTNIALSIAISKSLNKYFPLKIKNKC
jgi:hypothetical protein